MYIVFKGTSFENEIAELNNENDIAVEKGFHLGDYTEPNGYYISMLTEECSIVLASYADQSKADAARNKIIDALRQDYKVYIMHENDRCNCDRSRGITYWGFIPEDDWDNNRRSFIASKRNPESLVGKQIIGVELVDYPITNSINLYLEDSKSHKYEFSISANGNYDYDRNDEEVINHISFESRAIPNDQLLCVELPMVLFNEKQSDNTSERGE